MKKKTEYIGYLESHKTALIELAQRLVQVESVHGNETAVAIVLKRLLERHGFKTRLFGAEKSRQSLLADFARGEPTFMFNGHLDTVPFGVQEKWREHPLSGTIRGNRLYGRGSYDMKCSVAAATFAAIALRETSKDFKARLRLVFNIDEEGAACTGIRDAITAGYLADAALVGEPMAGRTIGIGARGCYRFELIVIGKSGHTSQKQGGINAVTKMAKALLALEKIHFKHMKHPLFLPPHITPGTLIEGGSGINVYPAECRAKVDCRLSLGMTMTSAKRQIVSCLETLKRNDPDFRYRIDDICVMNPAISNSDDRVVSSAAAAIRSVYGYSPKIGVMGGGSDANHLINAGVPCVLFGVDGGQVHAENEYASLPDLLKTAKAYAHTAAQYLRSE